MGKNIECFEDLIIWQKAIEFAKQIYLITGKKGLRNDFGLKGQIRDAAVSISNNISEGLNAAPGKNIYISSMSQKVRLAKLEIYSS